LKAYKEIFCTLGPSTLNKDFLKFSNGKISLLRLNMSHIPISKLKNIILYVKKFSKVPICIDTEGAQIRTKTKRKKKLIKNNNIYIFKHKGDLNFYPPEIFSKIKKNDILNVGFDNLKIKVTKKEANKLRCKILSSGSLENNKGVHLENRTIKLDYLTMKDKQAIIIGKKMNIKYFALSFTNSHYDIIKFNKLLKSKVKIFKLETSSAIKNLNQILSAGNKFLIDRGDLSKDISTEMLPHTQKRILLKAKKLKKTVYVATDFLDSMLKKSYPTRGEANDVYNTLEMGAAGLVLAAETAIGKYPKECVIFLRKIIKIFKTYK